MRFRLSAKVECTASAPQLFEASGPDDTLGFRVDKTGRVTDIWVEAQVPEFRDFLPRFLPRAGTRDDPHEVSMPVPPQADRLRSLLQYIESIGSFWLGIRRVAWSEAEMSWEPDSEEEMALLHVRAFTSGVTYPETPVEFSMQRVVRLLAERDKYRYLVIPMSFYREGINEYKAQRYVSAFYNFYFLLEDLYGRGKTKNAQVMQAFLASPQFMAAVSDALTRFEQDNIGWHKLELMRFVSAIGGDYSPRGIVRFLVHARGELHHFSQRSTRPKGHPLNQAEWHSVAFFAMCVCMSLLAKLVSGTEPDSFQTRAG